RRATPISMRRAMPPAAAGGLRLPPQQIVVPGRHFVFIDPCPPAIAAEAPLICADAPGIDRKAIHRHIEAQTAAFLLQSLQAAP
ncbi:MAG: hypothetical protein ACREIP_19940, partial [Alphaproteobacteria bacterium]